MYILYLLCCMGAAPISLNTGRSSLFVDTSKNHVMSKYVVVFPTT